MEGTGRRNTDGRAYQGIRESAGVWKRRWEMRKYDPWICVRRRRRYERICRQHIHRRVSRRYRGTGASTYVPRIRCILITSSIRRIRRRRNDRRIDRGNDRRQGLGIDLHHIEGGVLRISNCRLLLLLRVVRDSVHGLHARCRITQISWHVPHLEDFGRFRRDLLTRALGRGRGLGLILHLLRLVFHGHVIIF